MISLNIEKTFGFISKESVSAYEAQVKAAQEALENGTGKGNDFLGWLHLPSSIKVQGGGHVDEAVLYDKRLVYIFVCHEFVQLDT